MAGVVVAAASRICIGGLLPLKPPPEPPPRCDASVTTPPGTLPNGSQITAEVVPNVPPFSGMNLVRACQVLPDGRPFAHPVTLGFPDKTSAPNGAMYFWSGTEWLLRLPGADAGTNPSAHIYEGGIYGYFTRSLEASCAYWDCTDIPSCSNDPAVTSFVADTALPAVASFGRLSQSGEPATSLTYSLQSPDGGPSEPVQALSPLTGYLVDSSCVGTDCSITLKPCREISIQVGLVAWGEPSEIMDGAVTGRPQVTAIEALGAYEQTPTVSFAVVDERVIQPLLNPARQQPWDFHYVCPLQSCVPGDASCNEYISSAVWAQYEGGQTTVPACRRYPVDVPGTALGRWFADQDQTTSAITGMWQVLPLVLMDDPDDPSRGQIGNKPNGASMGPPLRRGAETLSLQFLTSPPATDDDFALITAGPEDGPGTVHCYDRVSGLSTFLMQMQSPTTLSVQFVDGDCASLLAHGGGSYQLQAGAAITFQR
jgi:hypothetical protein